MMGIPKVVADTGVTEDADILDIGEVTAELPVADLAPEEEGDGYEFSAVQVMQDARLKTDTTGKGKSEITVDSGETRIVTQMEPKAHDLGAEITVKAEQYVMLLAEETSLLEIWRARRDSLSDIVSQSEKKRDESSPVLKSTAFSAPKTSEVQADSELLYRDSEEPLDKDELKQVLDSVYNEVIRHDPEYQLLEAHYQVAAVTTDDHEYDESVKYLRDYLEREDSAYKIQAAWYLQQLGEID